MQVVLVMFRSDGERRSFSVVRDVTVLGRREDCDLRIPLGDISRKHCRFIKNDDRVRLEDLGSSNGTLCNGERITTVELQPGDTVVVGPVTFVVQINGSPPDDQMNPYADRSSVAQDTAVAAAAVGVGSMQEIDPDFGGGIPTGLDPVDSDLGAAPLIASADDDDQDAVAALEPLDDADEQFEELEPVAELEPIEELEPVEELETVDELEPVDELTSLEALEPSLEDPEPTPATMALPVPPPLPAPPAAKKRVVASPPPEPATEDLAEPIEGELQASEEFENVAEQSGFEIIMDDVSQGSASGDVQIDWDTETKK